MTTTQIIKDAERLPLSERLEIIEALSSSIKRELSQKIPAGSEKKNEPFGLITFDLGQEVQADHEEIYVDSGI